MTNPFNPNRAARNKNMKAAAAKVAAAIAAIEAAQASADNWADYETMGYFKDQLVEFLSSDNGEAGLEAYLKMK